LRQRIKILTGASSRPVTNFLICLAATISAGVTCGNFTQDPPTIIGKKRTKKMTARPKKHLAKFFSLWETNFFLSQHQEVIFPIYYLQLDVTK
jgi:hypothetical protein